MSASAARPSRPRAPSPQQRTRDGQWTFEPHPPEVRHHGQPRLERARLRIPLGPRRPRRLVEQLGRDERLRFAGQCEEDRTSSSARHSRRPTVSPNPGADRRARGARRARSRGVVGAARLAEVRAPNEHLDTGALGIRSRKPRASGSRKKAPAICANIIVELPWPSSKVPSSNRRGCSPRSSSVPRVWKRFSLSCQRKIAASWRPFKRSAGTRWNRCSAITTRSNARSVRATFHSVPARGVSARPGR